MTKILIIGGASLDTLHIKGQTYQTAGGAGLYTALAAIRCGVEAGMCAPKPQPMPGELTNAAEMLAEWRGPLIEPQRLPHFEIEHTGDKATYLKAAFGSESELNLGDLPDNLNAYDCVHLTPLGDSRKQQQFLLACRERGARFISAGTYLCTIRENAELIRKSIDMANAFFMNEEEACLIFGSLEQVKGEASKLIFVTLGEKGVLVVQGNLQTKLNAIAAEVVDPTGAGDSFCGATLAGLARGAHPVMAAREASRVAARQITAIGPAALMEVETRQEVGLDERVRLDHGQISAISKVVKSLSAASPFNFTGKDFPPEGDAHALEYFFVTILQQFSFWDTRSGRYDHPLVDKIDGDVLKGSAYLFRAYTRKLLKDPEFFTTARQSSSSLNEMQDLFRADHGGNPMPATELHLQMAQAYGLDMLALRKTPQSILACARQSETPLKTFIQELDKIGGYKEDPLRKKSNLLALVLNQRPEKFLDFAEGEAVPPVIDYHTMRGCLRMGLVDILDEALRVKIENREIISEAEEWAIRYASYLAVEDVVKLSGKSLGAVDWFFFAYSRQRCPEMSEPVCSECAVDPVCAHRKRLFQPVLRTTFY